MNSIFDQKLKRSLSEIKTWENCSRTERKIASENQKVAFTENEMIKHT